MWSLTQKTLLTLLGIVLALLLAEGLVRLYLRIGNGIIAERVEVQQAAIARSATKPARFKPHPYLAYAPADVVMSATGCTIAGDSFLYVKPPDTLRIACLGGSTTMRAYPTHLAEELCPSFGNTIEIMDWGCAGWTVVESSINYLIRASDFQPDVVILHHGMNDMGPRLRNTYQLDYSHYRRPLSMNGPPVWLRWLRFSKLAVWLAMRSGMGMADLDTQTVIPYKQSELYGNHPPTNTLMPYRNSLESIHTLTQSRGVKLILAGMIWQATKTLPEKNVPLIEEHNQLMRTFADKNHIEYADLQTSFQHRPEDFNDASHLNRLGNRRKAAILANAVAKVMNATPRIEVRYPEKNESKHPTLIIHWNFKNPQIDSVHVYVQVDGGPQQYLGQTTSNTQSQLIWRKNAPNIAPPFREGPQPSRSYRFHAWTKPPLLQSPVGMYKDVILTNSP